MSAPSSHWAMKRFGLRVASAFVVLSSAGGAQAEPNGGGHITVFPSRVAPGDTLRVAGEMRSGPAPCDPQELPPGSVCSSEPVAAHVHREGGRASAWTTIVLRVGSFRAVLGRIRLHGWNKTFDSTLTLHADTPSGHAVVVARTARYGNVATSRLLITGHPGRTSARTERPLPVPSVVTVRAETNDQGSRGSTTVRWLALAIALGAVAAFGAFVSRRRIAR